MSLSSVLSGCVFVSEELRETIHSGLDSGLDIQGLTSPSEVRHHKRGTVARLRRCVELFVRTRGYFYLIASQLPTKRRRSAQCNPTLLSSSLNYIGNRLRTQSNFSLILFPFAGFLYKMWGKCQRAECVAKFNTLARLNLQCVLVTKARYHKRGIA